MNYKCPECKGEFKKPVRLYPMFGSFFDSKLCCPWCGKEMKG